MWIQRKGLQNTKCEVIATYKLGVCYNWIDWWKQKLSVNIWTILNENNPV